ncbi:unnamed protein product [Didymodactylos carnosus]|uniref:N-acetyltransferase domain-containing protein n=1 Tax=Didymodactylos carnosus TaxID=1234261 RepID=A0A8S2IC04_9BILA|nr:unnamed protein product [Didymodactylos carnosus]CAF3740785.1 unnamed protein product [Didymodactylos carnosus]
MLKVILLYRVMTFQFNNESVMYRPLTNSEQSAALTHWRRNFPTTKPDFFDRYYSCASPTYVEGDTLGAFYEGSLVSTVHICRLKPHEWNDDTLLCGGIANVPTVSAYRCHGLSSHLLTLAIENMTKEGFHYSLLGTDRYNHYAALGWEQLHLTYTIVQLDQNLLTTTSDTSKWIPFTSMVNFPDLSTLYENNVRPLQFERSPSYFEHWVGWNWRKSSAFINVLQGKGYIVLSIPDDEDE